MGSRRRAEESSVGNPFGPGAACNVVVCGDSFQPGDGRGVVAFRPGRMRAMLWLPNGEFHSPGDEN